MNRKKHKEHIPDFPYYKIQYWDEFSICWVYIHKTFPDPPKAENFALTIGKKYRIMEVMRSGEKPFNNSG